MPHHRFRRSIVAGITLAGLALVAPPARAERGGHRPSCVGHPSEGGDWTGMGGDLAATRYQAEEHTIGPSDVADLEVSWVADIGVGVETDGGVESAATNSTPTVAHGCVFAASAAGDVVARDVESGDLIWQRHLEAANPGLGGTIVGAVVVEGATAVVFVNDTADGSTGPGAPGPYAVALDVKDGSTKWTSEPFDTYPGTYTNASPAILPSRGGAVVFAGWSPPEGDSFSEGGFVLIDLATGQTVKKTYTIPEADWADTNGDGVPDYAGGGIWAPPAYDEATGFAYVGASNPYSKKFEHEHTNAILKIDVSDRSSATFGEIVDSYKGVPDQYREELTALSQTPVCDVSDVDGVPTPFDDPACGQIDLDFGAPVNVVTAGGRTMVIGLQKAGIVWAFDTDSGQAVWQTTVGGPCAPCNAAATAVGPDGVVGVSAPGGLTFDIDTASGALRWVSPVGDGSHYEGTTIADGVAYTIDNAGNLLGYDTASGTEVLRRNVIEDLGAPAPAFSSVGISIAEHTLFVPVSVDGLTTAKLLAYRLPS